LPLQVLITNNLIAAATILLEFDSSLIDAVVPCPNTWVSPFEWCGDKTALHIAVLLNYEKEVCFLLKHNANTEIETIKGKKAIDLIDKYDYRITELFQNHSESVNIMESQESKPSLTCRA
jgi:hypothetical protein